jgi:hypothetical protein
MAYTDPQGPLFIPSSTSTEAPFSALEKAVFST